MKNNKALKIICMVLLIVTISIIAVISTINKNKEQNNINNQSNKQQYLSKVKELTEEKNLKYDFDESDNSLTITSEIFITGGDSDKYLNKWISESNTTPEDMEKLKNSMIDLCKSIDNMKLKFGEDIDIEHITIKAIDKDSNKEFFIVEDAEIKYNAFEEKQKKQKETKEKHEKMMSENTELINNIQRKYKYYTVTDISKDEEKNKKILYIDSYKQENLDATYSVLAEFLTHEETNLKRNNITDIVVIYYYNNESEGIISSQLQSDGRYKAVVNTLK